MHIHVNGWQAWPRCFPVTTVAEQLALGTACCVVDERVQCGCNEKVMEDYVMELGWLSSIT